MSATDQSSSVEGERRHVTVLFADLVGFTAFSERSGEEAAYKVMQEITKLLRDAVLEHGGTVKNFTGDGIMALFGVPTALEDGPLRACRAALLIQERLAAGAVGIEVTHGFTPQLRIGINSGPVVVGHLHGAESITALGDTVNLASRLQALAEPGAVILSDRTQRLVEGMVDSCFVGEHPVKGKAQPQRVFRLEAIRKGAMRFDAAVSRGLTTYVGRDRELEMLEHHVAETTACLHVIDIVGEPGIGKSRLIYEFRQRIGSSRAFILSGSCSADGQRTPFLPFIEIVRGSFRVAPERPRARWRINSIMD
jgi:class 3 adenylate cyclase